ncbi:hypothetical protein T01_6118 [Trichinella spiralis]|uniref:Uncharacterized protein n=1 Tax=Trichinella spiralis TaxID=6334 RepID=A0A0V1AS78_TRISP|nr:hypothetical protein T01_6118 [Trichinella spiralis]
MLEKVQCWQQLTGHKNIDVKKLSIPFRYHSECTIHAPSFGLPQQSNVVTCRKHHNVPQCTLPQQQIFTGLRCPECVRDLQVLTMLRKSRKAL